MGADVAGADHEGGEAFGADGPSGVLPSGVGVARGVDVQVLHDGPHAGEHVFGDALAVCAGGVGEHGSGLEDAGFLVAVDAGAPGLQPFEVGALRAFLGRDVADDRGGAFLEFLGDVGVPLHVAALRWVAYEFLRHAFGRAREPRLFRWRQRQAVDDQFAIVFDSHVFHPRSSAG